MRRVTLVAALLALAAFTLTANAADKLGVVMIHGKQGRPTQFDSYETPFAAADFLTARPVMCWSRERIYDKTYPDCLAEIDAAADQLRARGASTIAIVGMSLGGNAALAYGARHSGLAAVVVLAPAHAIETLDRRQDIAESIVRARALTAQGRGDIKAGFAELNTGVDFIVTTTPRIYLSFHGPDSIASLTANVSKLSAPLLWIAGSQDRSQRHATQTFALASKNPLNRFVSVESDHRGTVAAGRPTVLEWLKQLARR
jgi:pimeloyl-ACP methyl ester carboxylesterase